MAKKTKKVGPNNAGMATKVIDHRVNGKLHNCNPGGKKK